ncbi:asparagine synthase-related protein [Halorhodospira halophila]|uniref:Asparagine synthetase domain-containing protein n=1 Tax=Halorhodospira halophila (strain DSM 244 / SL1) TaxID=349124 RepID=A1WXB1_HALHL|nr:asparagine synthase-related protein [Halorhodospira halophila]ABM62323.1 conserved hypothetical protein [Halorhodospira halophila SL1]MBK1730076.1 hypothetical protein [Halorhodospira halophila]
MYCLIDQHGAMSGHPSHQLAFDKADDEPTLLAWWAFDGECLQIQADRLGVIPLFHGVLPTGGYVVSDSLLEACSLAGQPLDLDHAAIAVFLRLGYYLGEDTPFRALRVLAPGERIHFTPRRLTRHVPDLPIMAPRALPRDAAIREYDSLFSEAIRARSVGTQLKTLPLSGGRDSRHILLELDRLGRRPERAVISARSGTDDTDRAVTLAKYLDLDIDLVTQPEDFFALEKEKNRRNHFLTDENAWYLPIAQHLQGTVLDGLGGDVLSNGYGFKRRLASLMADNRLSEAASFLLPSTASTKVLKPFYRDQWSRTVAMNRLHAELARHAKAPNPVASFLFWNRTRREVALIPLTLIAPRADVALPYLDASLLDFFLSLPAEDFGEPGFHDEVLATTYPKASQLPYATKKKATGQRWARIKRSRAYHQQLRAAFDLYRHGHLVGHGCLPYLLESFITGHDRPISWPFRPLHPLEQLLEHTAVRM